MSSPLAARSISLNIPHSNRPNRHHDLRYSLSANPRSEDRPQPGNGVAGIIYKWINYGQGWKRRWFVLQDGVLSYYRIHGPDKISLSVEMGRRSKLIGGESLRFICRHSKRGDVHSPPGKPLGQIHLKVSSIGESISDSKRFTVFTGTKSLHLRAASSEDRTAWIEALHAVKETFPRISNEELMATTTNVSVSTDKLRQRLMKEEVDETIIKDCEDIMKDNFIALHNEVTTLKQYQCHLVDTLKNVNSVPELESKRATF
ncbi:hypothetical protein Bca52824_025069 [Brassica carinata]|uniref:PH domain-containing protein n=1 Tax=Brassica carinata TaxID=52824 RepID=A0A8X8AXF3_BRACI|nr:hypothetical protein Bca52824_025069 [Brassica carinata]